MHTQYILSYIIVPFTLIICLHVALIYNIIYFQHNIHKKKDLDKKNKEKIKFHTYMHTQYILSYTIVPFTLIICLHVTLIYNIKMASGNVNSTLIR